MIMFGRKNKNGDINLLDKDGYPITRLDDSYPIIYPVNSNLSAYYEHPNGLIITEEDAKKLDLDIED